MIVRSDQELLVILDHIAAATAPEPEPKPIGSVSIFDANALFPALVRACAMSSNGRQARLDEMARALAEATRTPDWIARTALEAVFIPGREKDLDDSENDPPALELAVLAMGLNPAAVSWTAGLAN